MIISIDIEHVILYFPHDYIKKNIIYFYSSLIFIKFYLFFFALFFLTIFEFLWCDNQIDYNYLI